MERLFFVAVSYDINNFVGVLIDLMLNYTSYSHEIELYWYNDDGIQDCNGIFDEGNTSNIMIITTIIRIEENYKKPAALQEISIA